MEVKGFAAFFIPPFHLLCKSESSQNKNLGSILKESIKNVILRMGVNNKNTGKWPEARSFLARQTGIAQRGGKRWNVGHMVLLRGTLSLPERPIEN